MKAKCGLIGYWRIVQKSGGANFRLIHYFNNMTSKVKPVKPDLLNVLLWWPRFDLGRANFCILLSWFLGAEHRWESNPRNAFVTMLKTLKLTVNETHAETTTTLLAWQPEGLIWILVLVKNGSLKRNQKTPKPSCKELSDKMGLIQTWMAHFLRKTNPKKKNKKITLMSATVECHSRELPHGPTSRPVTASTVTCAAEFSPLFRTANDKHYERLELSFQPWLFLLHEVATPFPLIHMKQCCKPTR